MKEEIDSKAIRSEDFSTLLSKMETSSRQKINQEIHDLNYTLDQKDLMSPTAYTQYPIPYIYIYI